MGKLVLGLKVGGNIVVTAGEDQIIVSHAGYNDDGGIRLAFTAPKHIIIDREKVHLKRTGEDICQTLTVTHTQKTGRSLLSLKTPSTKSS